MASQYKYLFVDPSKWANDFDYDRSNPSSWISKEMLDRLYESLLRRKLFLDCIGEWDKLTEFHRNPETLSHHLGSMVYPPYSYSSSSWLTTIDDTRMQTHDSMYYTTRMREIARLATSLSLSYPFVDPTDPSVSTYDTGKCRAYRTDSYDSHNGTMVTTKGKLEMSYGTFPSTMFFRLLSDASYLSDTVWDTIDIPDFDSEEDETRSVRVSTPKWHVKVPDVTGIAYRPYVGSDLYYTSGSGGPSVVNPSHGSGSGIECSYYKVGNSNPLIPYYTTEESIHTLLQSMCILVPTSNVMGWIENKTASESGIWDFHACRIVAGASYPDGYRSDTESSSSDVPYNPSKKTDVVGTLAMPKCPFTDNYWRDYGLVPDFSGTELEEPMKAYVVPSVPPIMPGMLGRRYPPKSGWPFIQDGEWEFYDPGTGIVNIRPDVDNGSTSVFYPSGKYVKSYEYVKDLLGRLRYTVIPVVGLLAKVNVSAEKEIVLKVGSSGYSDSTTVDKAKKYARGKYYDVIDTEESHYATEETASDIRASCSSVLSGQMVFDATDFQRQNYVNYKICIGSGESRFSKYFGLRYITFENLISLQYGIESHFGLGITGNLAKSWSGIVETDGTGTRYTYSYYRQDRDSTGYATHTGTSSSKSGIVTKDGNNTSASFSSSAKLCDMLPLSRNHLAADVSIVSVASYPGSGSEESSESESESEEGSVIPQGSSAYIGVVVSKQWATSWNGRKHEDKADPSQDWESSDDASGETEDDVMVINSMTDQTITVGDVGNASAYACLRPELLPFVRSADLYAVVEVKYLYNRTEKYTHTYTLHKEQHNFDPMQESEDDVSHNDDVSSSFSIKKLVKVGTLDRTTGFFGNLDLGSMMETIEGKISGEAGLTGCPFEGCIVSAEPEFSTKTVYSDGQTGSGSEYRYDVSYRRSSPKYTYHSSWSYRDSILIVGMFILVDWDFDLDYDPWDSESESSESSESESSESSESESSDSSESESSESSESESSESSESESSESSESD